ncbi:hypothetical protein [Citrobacter arsenatis]|uniref:hypothetical protein n=1 Tax=Citrobacter arsenatis TaxID=2546350 RepID=UPI00300E58D7
MKLKKTGNDHNASLLDFFFLRSAQVIRHSYAFFIGFNVIEWVKVKVGFGCVGDLAVNERIGIANLIFFMDKRSNMKRTPFLSVSYQNKKTKDLFVHASPYSYCIAPVRPLSPSISG